MLFNSMFRLYNELGAPTNVRYDSDNNSLLDTSVLWYSDKGKWVPS